MPYRQIYEDAPKDMSLPVLAELPDGIVERGSNRFEIGPQEASGYVGDDYKTYHYCERCGGWIPGHANDFRVNTLDPSHLAGRQGVEYYCRRCGNEIYFLGMMS